ncbi:hypothetical protein PsorP6_018649 [Peronosclerospora sorghi]|nr:hypothetical protein PsorP6_018649 [Peronosclerospora sorghi]
MNPPWPDAKSACNAGGNGRSTSSTRGRNMPRRDSGPRMSPLLHAVHFSVVALGGVAAHVRSSWTAAELCQCIFPTSNATLVVVDALETLSDVPKAQRPRIRPVIVLDRWAMEAAMAALRAGVTVIGARDLPPTQATTDAAWTPSLDALARRVWPDHCFLLTFEYDHVGRIRGAELSHDNVLFTAAALVQSLDLVSRNRLVGFTSHSSRDWSSLVPPRTSYRSCASCPSRNRPCSLLRPRSGHALVTKSIVPKSDVNAALYSWAKTPATNNSQKLLFAKGKGGKHRSMGYMLSKTLVLDTIKKKIGLEGSPLDLELERLIKTVGTPIYQLYGTPETSGFASTNFPHVWASHETVLRVRNVLLGYRSSPGPAPEREEERESIEQRASTCDSDGWLLLGQRGLFKPNGFLKISDPTDFVVLATGDWIPIRPF